MITKPAYLIDEIILKRRVHLLGGVSDAGKTRWVLPAMLDWQAGRPVLGRASIPVPWAYVIGDRTLEEAQDSMRGMDIEPGDVRCIPAFGSDNKNIGNVLTAAQRMTPPAEFLVWEGFQDLPQGDRRQEVRSFLSTMSAYCSGDPGFPRGLTILGVAESPKLKPTERYTNPRQRVSGVSAWSYHTSTILLLESTENDPSFKTLERTLWICSKVAQRREVALAFNPVNGRLLFQREVEAPQQRKSERVPLILHLPTH